jgi:virginiamycin B lyase
MNKPRTNTRVDVRQRRVGRKTVVGLVVALAVGATTGLATAHALVITEIPVPMSPFGVTTLGADTYFTQADPTGVAPDRISKLTGGSGPATTLTTLPAGSNPKSIVAAPDGALWFTEQAFGANKIGRVTTAGALTTTTIATPQAGPVGIAVGPDGNIWFAETHAAKIGRLHLPCTAGSCAVDEYSAPNAGDAPQFLAAGPAASNTVFFTARDSGKIGVATITGPTTATLVDFTIPTAGSQPYGIALGGDNNMWFTEHTGNKIGRITLAGTITEFPVPTRSSAPSGIAKGPDGSLWYTEQNGNNVGNISVTGASLGEFSLPTSAAQPLNLIASIASPTRLWLTESTTDKVGFFNVSSGTSATVGYVLDGYGGLHLYASAGAVLPSPHGGPYWPGFKIARAVAVAPGTDAGYVLDGFGGIHPFTTQDSTITATGSSISGPYFPGFDIARDIVVRPDGRSGYLLDGYGGIWPWHEASVASPPAVTNTGYWSGFDIARRLVLNPADATGDSGYVLDGFGGIHPFGTAGHMPTPINAGATGAYWPGFNIARDLVLTGNGAGYTLDGYGGVHPVGTANRQTFAHDTLYFPRFDIARALVLSSDRTGAYLLDGWGGVHPIGTAPALRSDLQNAAYWPGWDIAHTMAGVG